MRESMVRNRHQAELHQAELLGQWARRTSPEERHVWPMTQDMNRLDMQHDADT